MCGACYSVDPRDCLNSCPGSLVSYSLDCSNTCLPVSSTNRSVIDACGQCGGNGNSCLDCKGIAFGASVVDVCGVCGGSNACFVISDIQPNPVPLIAGVSFFISGAQFTSNSQIRVGGVTWLPLSSVNFINSSLIQVTLTSTTPFDATFASNSNLQMSSFGVSVYDTKTNIATSAFSLSVYRSGVHVCVL